MARTRGRGTTAKACRRFHGWNRSRFPPAIDILSRASEFASALVMSLDRLGLEFPQRLRIRPALVPLATM